MPQWTLGCLSFVSVLPTVLEKVLLKRDQKRGGILWGVGEGVSVLFVVRVRCRARSSHSGLVRAAGGETRSQEGRGDGPWILRVMISYPASRKESPFLAPLKARAKKGWRRLRSWPVIQRSLE